MMKGKYMILAAFSLLIMFNLSISVQALTASAEWSCSVDDEYYVLWTQHPVLSELQMNIPTTVVYEKVKIEYIGSALAAHETIPTTQFEFSINVTGSIWNGLSWTDVSPVNTETQMTLWNSSNDIWFTGGLFSGVPIIAPKNLNDGDRQLTIGTSQTHIWTGTPTFSENTGSTPHRWTFGNGTNSLIVGYEADGFLTYYYLDDGENIYECTCQTTVPTLPTPIPDVPGAPIEIISIISILATIVLVMKTKRTTRTV
jgi:hypothetical protein